MVDGLDPLNPHDSAKIWRLGAAVSSGPTEAMIAAMEEILRSMGGGGIPAEPVWQAAVDALFAETFGEKRE